MDKFPSRFDRVHGSGDNLADLKQLLVGDIRRPLVTAWVCGSVGIAFTIYGWFQYLALGGPSDLFLFNAIGLFLVAMAIGIARGSMLCLILALVASVALTLFFGFGTFIAFAFFWARPSSRIVLPLLDAAFVGLSITLGLAARKPPTPARGFEVLVVDPPSAPKPVIADVKEEWSDS